MPRTGTPVSYGGGADVSDIFEKLQHDRPGVDGVDFGKPEFFKSAKLWDCFSWLSSPYARGLFLSDKAKEVFAQFNLGSHRFYPFNAIFKDKNYGYNYLHIQSDETGQIDFAMSSFYVEEKSDDFFDPNVYELYFQSQHEYEAKNKTFSTNAIRASEIKLKPEFDKTLDIFTFANVDRSTIISARLRTAIEDQKLTGFQMKDVNIKT